MRMDTLNALRRLDNLRRIRCDRANVRNSPMAKRLDACKADSIRSFPHWDPKTAIRYIETDKKDAAKHVLPDCAELKAHLKTLGGNCAGPTVRAIEAGFHGAQLACVINGTHPDATKKGVFHTWAIDYPPFLLANGFVPVKSSHDQRWVGPPSAQPGDVVVFGGLSDKDPYGHIALYTGQDGWMSDYRQAESSQCFEHPDDPHGFYPNRKYKDNGIAYTIYRHLDAEPLF